MQLSDVVRARRMVRSYDPDRAVPLVVIRELLALAVRAPSAGFSQGWDFVVLHRPEQVATFWAATTDPGRAPDAWLRGMRTAPALVLCLSDPERYLDRYAEPDKARAGRAGHDSQDTAQWPVPYWDVDTGMAALLMLLGAVDAGLAGCFFGVPAGRHDAVREAFGVPSDRRIVGVVSLGHPALDQRSASLRAPRRPRRPLSDLTHDGHFGTPLPQP